jgi:epoxyqueuosine reductase
MTAIGNSADPGLVPSVVARLDDDSALVRGAAVWALARLDANRFAIERGARLPDEGETTVRAEWEAKA